MATVTDYEGGEEPNDEVPDIGDFLTSQVEVDIFYDKENGGIEAILGKPLVFLSSDERTGGKGKFYTITANATTKKGRGNNQHIETKKIGFNCGSTIVMEQMDKMAGHMPFSGIIESVKSKSSTFEYLQIVAAR